MIVNKMTVAGSEFFLDADQDVEGAKHRVVEAVQSGGGLVDVVVSGHCTVSVLVSQRIPVTFEEIVTPDDPQDDDRSDEFWKWADLAL